MGRFPRSLCAPFAAVLLPPALASWVSTAEAADISGFVRDAGDGESLPFATVYLEGRNRGDISNESGYYAIAGVPRGNREGGRSRRQLRRYRVVLEERSDSPGTYAAAPELLPVVEGETYRLEVRHEERLLRARTTVAADGFRLYAEKGEDGNMKVTAYRRSPSWPGTPP